MQNNFCQSDSCFSVISSGEDVNIAHDDCEIQVDITARRVKSVVIWGHVVDCKHMPIERALVKLLQYVDACSGELRGICHTYTDCDGFYQFDVPSCRPGKYRVMVSKAAYGNEKNTNNHKSPQGYREQDDWGDESRCRSRAHSASVTTRSPKIPESGYTTRPNAIYYY